MKTTLICDAAIIGAGPAGLIAADFLSAQGFSVALFDHMPSVARKFLMAGRGGLNLTHSEPLNMFLTRYGASCGRLEPMIRAFSPDDLRHWCAALGIETFIGSSGRVFPRQMKASPLLRALMQRLEKHHVQLFSRHDWRGWQDDALLFDTPVGTERVSAKTALLAMGGASWPRLGSNGHWAEILRQDGHALVPFQPANCGLCLQWSAHMQPHFGRPLKNVTISHGPHSFRGDVILSRYGLEGGPVYPLSNVMRLSLTSGTQPCSMDLRPDWPLEKLAAKLAGNRARDSLSTRLKRALSLDSQAIALMRESGPLPSDAAALARLIKAVPLMIDGLQGLERAISTAGGLAWQALDGDLQLVRRPHVFAAGEMIDWDAPTGGYLLQASFSSGLWAAKAMAKSLQA